MRSRKSTTDSGSAGGQPEVKIPFSTFVLTSDTYSFKVRLFLINKIQLINGA
jgi:hypothetical protein